MAEELKAIGGHEELWDIPFELAESAKACVGQTLIAKKNGKRVRVDEWRARNYVLCDIETGMVAEYPVMVILQQLQTGNMTVEREG